MTSIYKRIKFTVSLPGEVAQRFEDRRRELDRYYGDNKQSYIESLIAYDMWAQKDHLLTGPCFQESRRRDELPRMWAEILRDYGKPGKTGSWFEHRLEELRPVKKKRVRRPEIAATKKKRK